MSEPAFHAGRFAALMQKGKFTDGKLAYASGVSRTMIYYLRKGEREKVSAENLAALAAALKTSPQYLLGVTEDASPEYKTMPPIVASIADLATQLPR